jgi:hypothetical protein
LLAAPMYGILLTLRGQKYRRVGKRRKEELEPSLESNPHSVSALL